MTGAPHPLRCETCKNYKPAQIKSNERPVICSIFGFKFGEFERFVDKLGCVSHSSTTSVEVLDELLKRIQAHKRFENYPHFFLGDDLEHMIDKLRQQQVEREKK